MSKVKFKLNKAGVGELMNSPEMSTILSEKGGAVAAAAGEGFEADLRQAGNRKGCLIKAATAKAHYKNFENNTLLKALEAGK